MCKRTVSSKISRSCMQAFDYLKTEHSPIQKTISSRLEKINKFLSGDYFEKQMRQAGFYFYFLFPQKTDEATFFFFLLH